MENKTNEEIVRERPAQIDVRYRPGNLSFGSDSDYEDDKSPLEKMLKSETEKENRRRQALGLGFVLGTPEESDGTILFNYDEPPSLSAEEEDVSNRSVTLVDSESTFNNALKRAIREQKDEPDSSSGSMESVDSIEESASGGTETDENRSATVNLPPAPSIQGPDQEVHTELEPVKNSVPIQVFEALLEPRPTELKYTSESPTRLPELSQEPADQSMQSPESQPDTVSRNNAQQQTEPIPSEDESSHQVVVNDESSGKIKKPNFIRKLFNFKKKQNNDTNL